jgi:signal peptidase I
LPDGLIDINCATIAIFNHTSHDPKHFQIPAIRTGHFMTSIQEAGRRSRWPKILLIIVLVILAIPIFTPLVFRTLLFQPFSIPAGSMIPTLLVGDHFFVSKYAYGYTRYSLPFAPRLFSGRIFGSAPARGDVAVFRVPRNDTVDYIKRVVGLPGDRIQMKEGLLHVNGTPVARERLADFEGGDGCGEAEGRKTKRWRETLPNGVSYETLDCVENGFYDNTPVYTVPADQFFVLGDNRDNSTDSRVLSSIGYIPLENFIGRAGMIFYSYSAGSATSAPGMRTERMGTLVR